MSNDIIITHELPAQFIALNHETLDEAMALCERAHGIVIPSAKLDESGCRSAYEKANVLYNTIDHLSKRLEEHRMAEGRKLTAVKAKIDEAVKAARDPLEDQRSKLGTKVMNAKRDLDRVVEQKRIEAERERLRVEQERRDAAEAAAKAQREAEAAAAAAAEAARKAAEAAPVGEDPRPDDVATVEAARAANVAATAAATAAQARTDAFDKVFEPTREIYVAPVPKAAVKTRTEYDVQIDDLVQVPREFGGVPLFTFDRSAALKLLKAGAKIPGLTLVETEATSSNRRSSAFGI